MNRPRFMTDEEKEKVLDLYKDGLNTVEIGSIIDRSPSSVERFLKKNGFTKFGKDRVSEEDIELIENLYLNDKLNAQEIWESEFKSRFSKSYIERVIRKIGISRGQGRGRYNKTLIHDYFKDIDNENKAYILGYVYADGSINDKTLRLECTYKDVEILEFIKKEINPNAEIHRYTRKGRNDTAVLYVSSIDIVNDLKNLGLIKNKQSKDIPIPSLKQNLMRHFIRGYFDGDGSITHNISTSGVKVPRISICTTKCFGDQLESILKDSSVITKPENNLIDMSRYGMNIYHLRISRISEIKSFYDYVYTNTEFFLKRKEEKMRAFLSNFPHANTEVTRNII